MTEAEFYAQEFGVSVDEARAEIRRAPEAARMLRVVHRPAGDALVDARAVHSPNLGIAVVLGAGADAKPIRDGLEQAGGLPFTVVSSSKPTTADLIRVTNGVAPDWVTRHESIRGIDLDARESKVLIFLDNASPQQVDNLEATLQADVPPPIDVVVKSLPGVTGEGKRGGYDMTSCTEGFSVRPLSGGAWGVTTARHCPNSQNWKNFTDSNTHGSNFQAELNTTTADIQWHTLTPSDVPASAYYHGESRIDAIAVTGAFTREEQLGLGVCHRGKTTEFSCGTVVSVNYRPTYDSACPGTCSPEFVRAEGQAGNLACFPGDSGGPFALGSAAMGIYMGQASSGTSSLDCNFAFYTPIGKVFGLGLALLTVSR